MDDKKILELQKMSKQYTREEMLRLNEEEPVLIYVIAAIASKRIIATKLYTSYLLKNKSFPW